MFDPNQLTATKAQKKVKKAAMKQIKSWIHEIIPIDSQTGLNINVEEVQCGDPVSPLIISIKDFSPRFSLSLSVFAV
jgi:hypothetical protein